IVVADKLLHILARAEDIAIMVEEQAQVIAHDMKTEGKGTLESPLLIINPLEGGSHYATDLAQALEAEGIRTEILSVQATTHDRGTGNHRVEVFPVKHGEDFSQTVRGRDVLMVDDIEDSGTTLQSARALLESLGASVKTAAMETRKVPKSFLADYAGME